MEKFSCYLDIAGNISKVILLIFGVIGLFTQEYAFAAANFSCVAATGGLK